MRGEVYQMTVRIERSIRGQRTFLRKGQRTFLLQDIHPVVFAEVYPDLTMAGFELIESRQLNPDEARVLLKAFKSLRKAGDIVTLAEVHSDLKATVEDMARTEHADIDVYRRRLKAVIEYAEDCMIPLPAGEESAG